MNHKKSTSRLWVCLVFLAFPVLTLSGQPSVSGKNLASERLRQTVKQKTRRQTAGIGHPMRLVGRAECFSLNHPSCKGVAPPHNWRSSDNPPQDPAQNTPPSDAWAPEYEPLLKQGMEALWRNEPDKAERLLTKAADLEPSGPYAFSLLGITYLYWKDQLGAAEYCMREAIKRGGSAVFRVFHDHDGLFVRNCTGYLHISADGVAFQADDGQHTFTADHNSIREFLPNEFVGSEYAAFHVKVRDSQKKTKNYNFAPWTNRHAEKELALRVCRFATRIQPSTP